MAEMKLPTPWDQRDSYPGFGYAGGFQNILTAYNGLNHRGAKKRYHDNQRLFEEQIDHLQALKRQLEEDEDDFFEMFGISSRGTPRRESFQRLNDKIEEWNDTNVKVLINDASIGNKFYEGLSAIQNLAIAAEITGEDWNNILNEAFVEKGGDTVRALLDSKPGMSIVEILNNIVGTDKRPRPFSTRSSLVDNLSVTIDDDGKIKIDSQQGNISPQLQKKIVMKLTNYFDIERNKKPNYDFKKMFTDLFAQFDISEEGQKCIKMALGNYHNVLEQYAFNSNPSQIKGFLGEVYNNAFLYFMADKSEAKKYAIESITPTGPILNTEGHSLVIDTWLRNFGIQVKNYEVNKVMREGFVFENSYNAGYFITHALQLDVSAAEASVGNILLNFFTAYEYNQDYGEKDASVTNTDGYKFWKQARGRMNDKFRDDKALTNIVTPYIDKLIGIDRSFSSESSNLFIENQEYRNTFFNISGKYIPSSVVVQAMIDMIEKQHTKLGSMIHLQARTTSHQSSNLVKWDPYITEEDLSTVYDNRLKYAATSHIAYEIKLDVAELANYLLTQI